MNNRILIVSVYLLVGILVVGAIILSIFSLERVAILIPSLLVSLLFVYIAIDRRRSNNLASTRYNNLVKRINNLNSALAACSSDLKLQLKASSMDARMESIAGDLKLIQEKVEEISDRSTSPTTETKIPGSSSATMKTPVALNRTSQAGTSSVYTLGLDFNIATIDGNATEPVVPSALPRKTEIPAGAPLLVDESGFSRGAWKSFGIQDDEFILRRLHSFEQVVKERRMNVVVLKADDLPEHLDMFTTWGSSAWSMDDAIAQLRSIEQRMV